MGAAVLVPFTLPWIGPANPRGPRAWLMFAVVLVVNVRVVADRRADDRLAAGVQPAHADVAGRAAD